MHRWWVCVRAQGKRHVVSRSDKRALSEEATALLARVYLQDINLLQFPALGAWSAPSRQNGSAAASVAVRAMRNAKLGAKSTGGKAKGKGKGSGKGKGKGPGNQPQ